MEGMGLLGIGHITLQYMETIAVFKMSSEVIKSSTIGAASFSQSPYNACIYSYGRVERIGTSVNKIIM